MVGLTSRPFVRGACHGNTAQAGGRDVRGVQSCGRSCCRASNPPSTANPISELVNLHSNDAAAASVPLAAGLAHPLNPNRDPNDPPPFRAHTDAEDLSKLPPIDA
jgi:hypothetical protein